MLPKKALLVGVTVCGALFAASRAAYPVYESGGVTLPSADVRLSFTQPGRVAKVHVKDGDLVKAGQLLVQLDDAIEQEVLAQLQAQSENMIRVEAAKATLEQRIIDLKRLETTRVQAGKATLDQKRIDLRRLEEAAGRGSATELEVEHARLDVKIAELSLSATELEVEHARSDVKIAELSLQAAQFEHEQDVRKYSEARLRVERMTLRSPITGTVENVQVETGESVQALAEAVRVVQTNPLWIDAHVPLDKAEVLKRKGTVEVRFARAEHAPVEGKIIYVSTVADAASDTLRARIEVRNDSDRPAGEHVRVIFGDWENAQETPER